MLTLHLTNDAAAGLNNYNSMTPLQKKDGKQAGKEGWLGVIIPFSDPWKIRNGAAVSSEACHYVSSRATVQAERAFWHANWRPVDMHS